MPKQFKKSHFLVILMVICVSIFAFTACSNNPTKDNMQDNAEEMNQDMKENGEDMADGTAMNSETMVYTLYFINKDGSGLAAETREEKVNNMTDKDTIDAKARYIVDKLIAGPQNADYERILPRNTKVNAVTLDSDGVLNLDLDENAVTDYKSLGIDEKLTVNAIAASLMQYPEIKKVRITIDKKPLKFDTKEYTDAFTYDKALITK